MDVINIILYEALYIWFQLHFIRSIVCVCVCVYLSIYLSVYIYIYTYTHTLLGGSVVNNLPAIQYTKVQSLGQEDPLEEGMEIHSSTLA